MDNNDMKRKSQKEAILNLIKTLGERDKKTYESLNQYNFIINFNEFKDLQEKFNMDGIFEKIKFLLGNDPNYPQKPKFKTFGDKNIKNIQIFLQKSTF